MTKLDDGKHLILALILATAAFDGLLEHRLDVDLPEGTISVVTLEALLKMKRLAGRAQDLADIEVLEKAT